MISSDKKQCVGVNSFPYQQAIFILFLGILKSCDDQEFIDEGKFVITFTSATFDHASTIFTHQFSSSCKMFITYPGLRLRATIVYKPIKRGCQHGYLSVGNDKYRPDRASLTSYQFCDHTENVEIVSRSNVLWVMITRRFDQIVEGHIEIQSSKPAFCHSSQFECSPIQCIPMTSLCDNVKDCDNGKDEYCDSDDSDRCFLCEDGECISPTLPRYHYNWGKPFWYICDGFKHCKDGSDEQEDRCKEPWSLGSDLHSCMTDFPGKSFLTWDKHKCAKKENCFPADDCLHNSVLHRIDSTSIAIVVCAFFVVFVFAICFIVKSGKKRKRRKQPSVRISSGCQIYRDNTSDNITTRLQSAEDEQQT
ncbi:Hypothetical predicted protein [Mytilus galloprovincialis]|uniref:CUB domain-containing protein n=2 Tax=Mytilus galloprovincialis TaxID=29158 RepID=A0A8B6CGI7_MYTGA|nr:Hypothetical predicted protein [Mytilus galloprovincialis]